MSQMNNKKPTNWKSATPKAVQPLKQARSNMVNAVNNAVQAEKAVQNAPMGKHAETMKHLQHADKQSSGAHPSNRVKPHVIVHTVGFLYAVLSC